MFSINSSLYNSFLVSLLRFFNLLKKRVAYLNQSSGIVFAVWLCLWFCMNQISRVELSFAVFEWFSFDIWKLLVSVPYFWAVAHNCNKNLLVQYRYIRNFSEQFRIQKKNRSLRTKKSSNLFQIFNICILTIVNFS